MGVRACRVRAAQWWCRLRCSACACGTCVWRSMHAPAAQACRALEMTSKQATAGGPCATIEMGVRLLAAATRHVCDPSHLLSLCCADQQAHGALPVCARRWRDPGVAAAAVMRRMLWPTAPVASRALLPQHRLPPLWLCPLARIGPFLLPPSPLLFVAPHSLPPPHWSPASPPATPPAAPGRTPPRLPATLPCCLLPAFTPCNKAPGR